MRVQYTLAIPALWSAATSIYWPFGLAWNAIYLYVYFPLWNSHLASPATLHCPKSDRINESLLYQEKSTQLHLKPK